MKMTIKIDGKDYEYYGYIDNDYIEQEINSELKYLYQIIEKLNEDIDLKGVSHRLGVYEEKGINAFVKKDGTEYFFGISANTFSELRNWFKMFFLYDKTYDVLNLKREKRDYYFQYTYRKALEFLLLHEYTHMKDGHCVMPQNRQKLIFEQSKTISREEALFSQTLEFDADNWAAAQCVVEIIEEDITAEEKNEKLKLLMFSIYTIFKKFSEYEEYNFDTFMDDELLTHTHPMAWIRYRYIVATILTNILDSSQEYKNILEKDLVKIIIDFEKQVLNISDLTEKMYTGAHTLKGTKHLLLLYNSWNKVAEELQEYAYDTLIKVTPMEIDAEKISIVDANGKVIL